MTTGDLTGARTAASADNLGAVAGLMPQALTLDPARLPLAKGWLLGLYLPAWVAEAGIVMPGRDLADVEADAQAAWTAHRAAARAHVDPAGWPALCDRVRDVARDTMQGSLEAAIRLPIEEAPWPAIEQRVWAVVEACIWAIAWRAVERAPGVPVEHSIPLALVPRRVELQRSAASIVLGATPPAPKVVPPSRVVDGVLLNADADVLAFMRERVPNHPGFGECVAFGLVRGGVIVGGVVFSSWRREARDIHVSGAVAPGFRTSPAAVRRVLRYVFEHLGCVRITLETGRRNKAARAFAERLGFKLEGVRRKGFDGRQDKILYGLLASECPLLKGARHG